MVTVAFDIIAGIVEAIITITKDITSRVAIIIIIIVITTVTTESIAVRVVVISRITDWYCSS